MKKTLRILIYSAILSVCCILQTAAAPYLKSYTMDIKTKYDFDENGDTANILNFTFEVSEKVDDGYLVAALYFEGKLDTVKMYDISQSTSLPEQNSETPKYIEIIHNKTPDCIKIFIWKSGSLKPVSKAQSLLNSASLEKTNAKIVDYLEGAAEETEKAKMYTISQEERDFFDAMINFANKAKKLNTKQLLTREFAYRYYGDDLDEIKNLFGSMNKELKKHVQDIFIYDDDYPGFDRDKIYPIIDYLGLKSYIFG